MQKLEMENKIIYFIKFNYRNFKIRTQNLEVWSNYDYDFWT